MLIEIEVEFGYNTGMKDRQMLMCGELLRFLAREPL